MSAGIAGFLAVTTGPRRLRSTLARATLPIRRSRRSLAGIRGVRGVFPEELFGGDLLAVLGARLRALLEPPAAGEEEPALRRLARRLARRDGLQRRPILPRVPGDESVSVRRTTATAGPLEPQLRPPARDAVAGEPDRPRSAHAGGAGGGAMRAAGFAPNGPLADRLRRYWQVERAAERARAAAGDAPGSPGAVRTPSLAAPPGTPSSRPGRPPLTDAELARELEAFVAGRPAAGGALSRRRRDRDRLDETPTAWADVPLGASGRVVGERANGAASAAGEPRPSPARPREAGRRAPGLTELADDMAAILREGARRHGIDLP